jgi:hypothetical protein
VALNPFKKIWSAVKWIFSPLARGLLQEVPYVLDRLWRHADFRVNRIGHVALEGRRRLVLTPAWRHGVLLMWAVMSAFAVFGPTTDAWCSMFGTESAAEARRWVGGGFIVAGVLIPMLVLNVVSSYMARAVRRRVERESAPAAPVPAEPAAPAPRAPPPATQQRARPVDFVLGYGGGLVRRLIENTVKLIVAIPGLPRGERAPTSIAFIVLMLGAALIAFPLLSLGATILLEGHDPLSCAKSDRPGDIVAQVVCFAVLCLGGLAIWTRRSCARALSKFVLLCVLFVVAIAALWIGFQPEEPSEARGGFYAHVYLLLVAALLAVALVSKPLALWIFWKFDRSYRLCEALRSVDLLDRVEAKLELSVRRVLSALTHGVGGHWLHFLLLPGFVALFAPSEHLVEYVVTAAVVSALLLTYGSLTSRWEQMIVYLRRWFLVGTPLVMSIAVIVVAALRFFKVQYVATVLDAAPLGVLTIFIAMMYVAFWFFEYFVNRWVGEELLALLGKRAHALRGFIHCPASGLARSWAERNNRYLMLHGSGQWLVQGWFERSRPRYGERKRDAAFTTYGFIELFRRLGGSDEKGVACAHAVERNVRLYFTFVNSLLIAAAFGLYCWHQSWSMPLVMKPTVTATALKPEKAPQDARTAVRDVLAERLRAQTRASRPSIVVAASGGGTRAAVYTSVALEGVAKLGRTRDVVLLSGVSGGGVATAVFASRFDTLKKTLPATDPADLSNAWSQYVAATAEPYIQDVLAGAGELRVAANTALGVLLAESLERRAFAPSMTSVRTIGDLHDIALILNSSVTGHPYDDSLLLRGRVAAPADSCVGLASPYANLAGGRLIFTNLINVSGFQQPTTLAPDMWLPYRVVNDGTVKLAAASSLTANFPPVFPNARVRIIDPRVRERAECRVEDQTKRPLSCDCDRLSYFVTDGGATENLGLVSALFALIGTLEQLAPVPDPHPGELAHVPLTDVHVLALEASAVDYDYSGADRGIGAATGGSKERSNAGLTQELLKHVSRLLARHGAELHVHYLPLPVAFRSRGGFGTHWMFAREIGISNPLLSEAVKESAFSRNKSQDQVALQKAEVVALWRSLFDPARPVCTQAAEAKAGKLPAGWTTGVTTVARWICGHDDRRQNGAPGRDPLPDFQATAWADTIRLLGSPAEVRAFEPYSGEAGAQQVPATPR